MTDLTLAFQIVALVLFILAAIPIPAFPYSGLVPAGLAFLTASFIF